jgi:hypothetical protein
VPVAPFTQHLPSAGPRQPPAQQQSLQARYWASAFSCCRHQWHVVCWPKRIAPETANACNIWSSLLARCRRKPTRPYVAARGFQHQPACCRVCPRYGR